MSIAEVVRDVLFQIPYLLNTFRSWVNPRGPQQNTPTVSLGYSMQTV